MRRMMAADFSRVSKIPSPHRARSFTELPGIDEAVTLLTELATSPCEFSPVSASLPLALYGGGSLGRMAHDLLNAVGHDIVVVIDRDAERLAQERCWSGVQLVHPDDLAEIPKGELRVAVSVVTSPYVPLERRLLELGFEDIVPFYDLAESFRGVHPLSNGWFVGPLTALAQNKTAEVLALWDDDMSRAHHLQFLAWRRLREEWSFDAAPISNCSRFFISEVASVLRSDEFLLDAGAHHGNVSKTFVEQTKGVFRQITAIEPDPFNRARLEDNLQSWLPDDLRITVYDCALAEDESEALFHAGLGYASQLSQTGQMSVTTRPLDALGLSPTFLKLHLEGAELPALKGARETLLASRPLIAATVYHNADGIWKTPLWLMETLPEYRFQFRAHSWCGTGAVIYAIPKERCVQ